MRIGLTAACVLASSTVALATPSVTATATSGATVLVLDGEGSATTHVVKIADVSLWTDAAAGLTVSISSGSLTKADGRTPIPFQVLLVDDGAAAPAAAAFTTPSGTTYTWSSTSAGSFERDLYIKYTPASLQDPGAYTASVDLSVVDN